MLNYIQRGEILDAIAPTGGVVSGQLLAIGQLIGVAETTAAAAFPFALLVAGVVTVPKAAQAFSMGDKLYFDATAKNITSTSTNNILAGFAAMDALAGDANVNLLLIRS